MVHALRQRTRLGEDLTGVTSVEEALQKADLDWGLTIVDASNAAISVDGVTVSHGIPGKRLVIRDDTNTTLGVVGHGYMPVDNRSVFTVADHILAAGGVFESGGMFDHGRRAFMRLGLPDANVLLENGRDCVRFGVNIKASHDGTGNVMAALEGIRLICANGMTARMDGLPHVFNVRHTANVATRMDEAREIMQGAIRYATGFAAAAQHMLDTSMSLPEFKTFLTELFPEPEVEKKRAHTIWEKRYTDLVELFHHSPTNEVGRGTAWAGYNAVTEFLDWEAPIRVTDDSSRDEVRALRQFDGTQQDRKDHAFALLT